MFIDFLLGGAIFIYAISVVVKHFKKSKKGKCATCALKDHCQSPCNDVLNRQ